MYRRLVMNWDHRDRKTWLKLRVLQLQRQSDHDGSAGTTQIANVYRWLSASLRVQCARHRRRQATSRQRHPLLRCWGSDPCSMPLTPSARAWAGHRFLRLGPPYCFTSIFACQGDHDSSAKSCIRMQNSKPYLQPFVRYWSSYLNERRWWRLQLEEF